MIMSILVFLITKNLFLNFMTLDKVRKIDFDDDEEDYEEDYDEDYD